MAAALAVLMGDPVTVPLPVAGLLTGLGIRLHLREQRDHEYTHEKIVHEHSDTHNDGHHDHPHPDGDEPSPGVGHRHLHTASR